MFIFPTSVKTTPKSYQKILVFTKQKWNKEIWKTISGGGGGGSDHYVIIMSDQKSFLINRPSLGRAGGEITLQLSNLKLAYQLCWPASILDQTSRQSWLMAIL